MILVDSVWGLRKYKMTMFVWGHLHFTSHEATSKLQMLQSPPSAQLFGTCLIQTDFCMRMKSESKGQKNDSFWKGTKTIYISFQINARLWLYKLHQILSCFLSSFSTHESSLHVQHTCSKLPNPKIDPCSGFSQIQEKIFCSQHLLIM